jgi:hypothetical protein
MTEYHPQKRVHVRGSSSQVINRSDVVAQEKKSQDFQKQLEAFMKEQKASQKLQEEAIAAQNERLRAQSKQIDKLQAALR